MSRIRAYLATLDWAMQPTAHAAMLAIVERWESKARLSPEEIDAAIQGAPTSRSAAPVSGRSGIAIVPLVGMISPRSSMIDDVSPGSGTSANQFSNKIRQAIDDPNTKGVLIDVHSPGGCCWGIAETAAVVRDYGRQGGQRKPVVAVANQLAASAATWIATAADEFVITPSGEAGWIGVYREHWNDAAAWDAAGSQHTYVYAGPYKIEGNEFEPLGDEARAEWQRGVDQTYARFLADVGAGRRVTPADVEKKFGGGRGLKAQDAVASGLADRIGTLESELDRMVAATADASGAPAPPGFRASVAYQRHRLMGS